jgi:hypothetical protein
MCVRAKECRACACVKMSTLVCVSVCADEELLNFRLYIRVYLCTCVHMYGYVECMYYLLECAYTYARITKTKIHVQHNIAKQIMHTHTHTHRHTNTHSSDLSAMAPTNPAHRHRHTQTQTHKHTQL